MATSEQLISLDTPVSANPDIQSACYQTKQHTINLVDTRVSELQSGIDELSGSITSPHASSVQGLSAAINARVAGLLQAGAGVSLLYNGTAGTLTISATGTVTSVGLALPNIFTVTGSPITAAGTLTASLTPQNANHVWAGPTSGAPAAPTFRALTSADLPTLGVAQGGTGRTALASGALLYGSGADTLLSLPPGSTDHVLTVRDGLPVWALPSSNPYAQPVEYDDFNSVNGRLGWVDVVDGADAAAGVGTATKDHPGVARLSTGTTSSGRIFRQLANGSLILGGGPVELDFVLHLAALSDGVEAYTLRIGLGDVPDADHDNGVYFEYAQTSSTAWRCKTASGGSRSLITASQAVATGWLKLGLRVDAAASEALFLLNGVQIASQTNNIPDGTVTPSVQLIKTSGTNPAMVDWDLFVQKITLTTAR